MSDTEEKPDLDELTEPGVESTDADYLAWRDAKVKAALKEADRHPEKMIPSHKVWEKFGFEY